MCRAPWQSCIMKIGDPGTSFCTWMKPRHQKFQVKTQDLIFLRKNETASNILLYSALFCNIVVRCCWIVSYFQLLWQAAALQVFLLLHHSDPFSSSTSVSRPTRSHFPTWMESDACLWIQAMMYSNLHVYKYNTKLNEISMRLRRLWSSRGIQCFWLLPWPAPPYSQCLSEKCPALQTTNGCQLQIEWRNDRLLPKSIPSEPLPMNLSLATYDIYAAIAEQNHQKRNWSVAKRIAHVLQNMFCKTVEANLWRTCLSTVGWSNKMHCMNSIKHHETWWDMMKQWIAHNLSSGMVPSGPKLASRPSPLHGMDGTPAVCAKMLASASQFELHKLNMVHTEIVWIPNSKKNLPIGLTYR